MSAIIKAAQTEPRRVVNFDSALSAHVEVCSIPNIMRKLNLAKLILLRGEALRGEKQHNVGVAAAKTVQHS